MSFSFDDVLKEIERLDNQNPDGWAVADLARESGINVKRCREWVREMIDTGKVRLNGRAKRISIDGLKRLVPVYVFIKKGAKREK
jgi:predicted transcriptional regulator